MTRFCDKFVLLFALLQLQQFVVHCEVKNAHNEAILTSMMLTQTVTAMDKLGLNY